MLPAPDVKVSVVIFVFTSERRSRYGQLNVLFVLLNCKIKSIKGTIEQHLEIRATTRYGILAKITFVSPKSPLPVFEVCPVWINGAFFLIKFDILHESLEHDLTNFFCIISFINTCKSTVLHFPMSPLEGVTEVLCEVRPSVLDKWLVVRVRESFLLLLSPT